MNKHIPCIWLRLLCLCMLVIISKQSFAEWNSFVINYHKGLYGKGSQTWQIAPYDNNWTYFANQNGLLQYDGNNWSLFPLHNSSDVRSVLASTTHQRIYAGGIHEFGFFEPGEKGQLLYTCLSDSMDVTDAGIGNIWGIHEADNILYIQGDSKVVKLLNGKFTVIDSGGRKIDCSDMVNGVLYVGTDQGVHILIGNTFFPLRGGDALITERIRGIIPHNNGALIVTAYNGLFYYNGETVIPFPVGIEEFIAKNEIFCIASFGDYIALGTVHKGIVVINRYTLDASYFNENNGLQNNTVLSLAFDSKGNLWAGLDSGIDYICLNSPLTNLYTYPHSYGTGYDALLHRDYLYLATNRGLYYTKYPVVQKEGHPEIKPVPNSSGQVWRLHQIGNDLFCLHDRGVFKINGTSLTPVSNIHGAWTCQLVKGKDNKMYVGVYDGLFLFEKINGVWKLSHRIEGVTDSHRFFEQESDKVIWMTDLGKLMRIELNDEYQHLISHKIFGAEEGLPDDKKIRVCKVKDKICFLTSAGFYQYNYSINRMEPMEEMNSFLKGAKNYDYMIEYNNHLIGLNNSEIGVSNLVNYKRGAETCIIPIHNLAVELVQGAERIVPISDSLFVIPNDNGFALAKLPAHKVPTDDFKLIQIRNVYITGPKDSLIYKNNFLYKKEVPSISYSHNALRFEYGVSSISIGNDVSYQYRFDNSEWSDFTNMQTKEYSNLSEGNHTFEVKAIFPDMITGTDSFSFRILPPWYRANIAYLLYFLIFALLIWAVYRWDDMRVKKKKQQVAIEKDKEIRAKEKEFEEENSRKEKQIIELEKEKLEHDLRYKSQEMANLMINFVRKNEILAEIKADLFKVISNVKGEGSKDARQMLLIVNSKIDSNMESDEVLKRIEEQFDLVHDNFMKRLRKKHPELSSNELMMCAYLKMSLSSKEIAPLLNISIRGVETIRYRVRKKLSLGREDSLTDYLNNKL